MTLPEHTKLLTVLVCSFLLSAGVTLRVRMDSTNNNSDELGKQPTGSILNTFSGFFTRDRAVFKDVCPALLTSYKELPDGETNVAEGGQTTSGDNIQGNLNLHQDNVTVQKPESSTEDSGENGRVAGGATVDPDLVEVTRVETYSDTENDEEMSHSSTSLQEKLGSSWKSTLPEEDKDAEEHVEEDEPKVPLFRTHKFKEKSRVEALLFSSKFAGSSTSKPSVVAPASKLGGDCSPKITATVSVLAETLHTEENTVVGLKAAEDDEYAGIDCSQPVPSVITGRQMLEAPDYNTDLAPPLKEAQNQEALDETAEAGSEEPHPIQVSTSVPPRPKTPEVLNQSLSNSEEQPNTASLTISGSEMHKPLLSSPEESLNDNSPGSSLGDQHTADLKMPETNIKPSLSSAVTSSSSASSSNATMPSPPSFQMPALFSGLRVLKKGAVGEDREVVSEIKQRQKDSELALLNLKKPVNKAKLSPEQKMASLVKKHPEPKSITESKSAVMGQLSQKLNLENHEDSSQSNSGQDGDSSHGKQECENGEEAAGERTPGSETPKSSPEKKKTSDLAYETFKSIFGPRTVTKEKTEAVDVEAVKKKFRNDKESVRQIFERTSKIPSKELTTPKETSVCSYKIEINK